MPIPWALLGIFAASAGALAFQKKEEIGDGLAVAADRIQTAWLPKGYRNNNPGCMRYIALDPYRGQVGADDDGIGIYKTMSEGYRAMGKQLLAYDRRGLRTVRHILAGIPSQKLAGWAPASENDTESYIKHVCQRLIVGPDTVLNVSLELPRLGLAIATHENGYGLHSLELIRGWMAT